MVQHPLLAKKINIVIRREQDSIKISNNRRILLEIPLPEYHQIYKKVSNLSRPINIKLDEVDNTIVIEKTFVIALPPKYQVSTLHHSALQILSNRFSEILENLFIVAPTFTEISLTL